MLLRSGQAKLGGTEPPYFVRLRQVGCCVAFSIVRDRGLGRPQ